MSYGLIILKPKLIIHGRIASVGYVVRDETVNNISECSKLTQK